MAHLRMSLSDIVVCYVVMNLFVDLFGSLLRGDQSVQASSNLHDEGRDDVSWKEAY